MTKEHVHFDVCLGNPPYQIEDGGGDGSSSAPVYQIFVEAAKGLNPDQVCMITPARWYSGGKGLDEYRSEMLHDDRLSVIHDYPETSDCFPGLNIRGGVSFFIWDTAHSGPTKVVNHKGQNEDIAIRPLLEDGADTFIRYNKAISILRKVKALGEETMDNRVSSRLPFGIPSNFSDYSTKPTSEKNIRLFRSDRGAKRNTDKRYYCSPEDIKKNYEWKDKYKVLVSKASPGGDEYPHGIITTPIFADKNSVCTETYLIADFIKTPEEGKNLISYMSTKFFRFLMGLIKNTQNISKGVFAFVPVQELSHPWTDEMLYEKYGITSEEITFIDSMIKPMSLEEPK